MKLTKEEEDQVVCKFLKNIADEGGEQLLKLTQFMLLRWSEEAIRINAGEIALAQVINHEGEQYNTIPVWLFSTRKLVKRLWRSGHMR